MVNFDTPELKTFINGCQAIIDAHESVIPVKLIYRVSKKNVKVVKHEAVPCKLEHAGIAWKPSSVFCFIDRATGNVLKPASYNAPAKGARGNIYDDNNGIKGMTWTGPYYLR